MTPEQSTPEQSTPKQLTPEQVKLYHETFKHFTTLASGSIVLVSTLLKATDKVTQVGSAYVIAMLVVANMLCINQMFDIAENAATADSVTRMRNKVVWGFGFAFGVLAVIAILKAFGF